MYTILAIDTSSTSLSAALLTHDGILETVNHQGGSSHAEKITQSVMLLLEKAQKKPDDISHVVLSAGPGSFTGLRIGFSFVKGYCIGRSIPVLPVSSLEILAHCLIGKNGPVTVAMDARQNRVFRADFTIIDNTVTRVSPDRLESVESFSQSLPEDSMVLGETLGYRHSHCFDFVNNRTRFISADTEIINRGETAAQIGLLHIHDSTLWKQSVDILPQYMQESYVVTSIEKGH